MRYQLPIHEYARREMLAGRFPLWIANLGAGLPLHAGQQAALCHPLLTPLVLICGAGYGLKLCLLAHLAMAYVGTYFLARYHSVSGAGAALAGLVATWSGFAVNHLMAGHVNLVLQYALVPWFWLALAALLRRPSALPSLALSAIGGCMALSGHPQVFYYTLLFGGFWALGSLLSGAAKTARVRCVAWTLISAATALLASSVQLIPSLELVREGMSESFRGEENFAAQHCLTGLDIARFVVPNAVGNPLLDLPAFGVGGSFHERVVYLGLLTPLLACYGLSRASVPRWQWGAAWLSLLALAISLGDSTPLFGWLMRLLPGLGLFRCPGRVFGVASILAALLAGRGLDALIHGERPASADRLLPWLMAVSCAATLAAAALVENADDLNGRECLGYAMAHAAETVIPFAAAAGGGIAALAIGRRAGRWSSVTACSTVCAVTFLDLGWCNARNFSMERPSTVMLPAPLVARGLPLRFVEEPIGAYMSRAQLRYSHLVPAAVSSGRQLLGTKEGGVLPAATERLFRAVQSNPGVSLAFAGCDYACRPFNGRCTPLPGSLPRLRLFAASDASLLDVPCEKLADADLQRMRRSQIGVTAISDDEPQRIVTQVIAPRDGLLVLADTWYPGWIGAVDGQQVKIERAHGVFRAVEVPAGKHSVVFIYKPSSFCIGLAASAAGTVLWTTLLVASLVRRKRRGCALHSSLGNAAAGTTND